MIANAPSTQVLLSQLKYPAKWHSYLTADPEEEVLECLQVSAYDITRTCCCSDDCVTLAAQATNREFGKGSYKPYLLFVEQWMPNKES